MWPFSEIKKLQNELQKANETTRQSIENFKKMQDAVQMQQEIIDKLTARLIGER